VENALPKGISVVNLPNVGRCDHSYANWISNMHQQLSTQNNDDDHVVVFLKDNIRTMSGFRARSLSDMIWIVANVGFACLQRPAHFKRSVFHKTDILSTFSLPEYSRLERDSNELFKSPEFSSVGDFGRKMNATLPEPVTPVCYGGNFAVQASQLLTKPKDFWQNLEQKLSRANNIEEGHFMERTWAGILSRPFPSEGVHLLLDKATEFYGLNGTGPRAFKGTLVDRKKTKKTSLASAISSIEPTMMTRP
jgi:hypothetical protein